MTAHEIAGLLAEIEVQLIASLRRHLSRHVRQENIEGIDWPAWQTKAIRGIDRYRRDNAAIIGRYATVIDKETEQLLRDEYAQGGSFVRRELQELGILDADDGDDGSGSINTDRLSSLVEDVSGSIHTAETASLRMMDDIYRRTVYRAELAAASGAVSMPQAVDMATKDFLAAGINCIEYADGRRVNIKSYAEMAIRTASLRSYLRGEADKRKEYGIDTVLCSQYGACSDTCLPWQGKVYIDDVYGNFFGERTGTMGKSQNGKWYLLLSTAIKGGLLHPNCRHTLSTYVDGITMIPPPLDANQVRRTAALEREQRRLERKVRKYKLLSAGTLDEDRAAKYRRRLKMAQSEIREHISEHSDVLRRDYWREQIQLTPPPNYGILSVKAPNFRDFDPDCAANHKLIDSREYRKKFDGMSGSRRVNSAMCDAARKAIYENDGRMTETIIMLDCKTGKEIDVVRTAEYGADGIPVPVNKNRIIVVHNHGNSTPPSFEDILSAVKFPEIDTLIAAGHDGSVYMLQIGKRDRSRIDFYKLEHDYQRMVVNFNLDFHKAVSTLSEFYGWRYFKR